MLGWFASQAVCNDACPKWLPWSAHAPRWTRSCANSVWPRIVATWSGEPWSNSIGMLTAHGRSRSKESVPTRSPAMPRCRRPD